jgi:hypothetical protein
MDRKYEIKTSPQRLNLLTGVKIGPSLEIGDFALKGWSYPSGVCEIKYQ